MNSHSEFLGDLISRSIPSPEADLLNGILLGISIPKGTFLYEILLRTGLLHIAVLSGMNISILASIFMFAIPKIGRTTVFLLSTLFLLFFTYIVGIEAPISRALIMYLFTSVSILVGRASVSLFALLMSAIFICVVWDDSVTSISFQLTVLSTLGIILFQQKIPFLSNVSVSGVWGYIVEECKLSLSSSVFTVPLIYYYFHQLSLISILSNICVSWTIVSIMIWGGVSLIIALIYPPLGVGLLQLLYSPLHLLIQLLTILASIPFAFIG